MKLRILSNFFILLPLIIFIVIAAADDPIHGVNLGGWLLLERFINPSLLANPNTPQIIDEWTLAQYRPDKQQVFETHYDTWLKEEELVTLKAAGITHIRIPLGYWSLCTQEELDAYNEPYYIGALPYLDRAIRWCKNQGLKVTIDLHGAPGSQNGWDNSGRQGDTLWGTGDTVNRTLMLLDRLAAHIANYENDPTTSNTVDAVGVLNEPYYPRIAGGWDTVMKFDADAYRVVRAHLPADRVSVVFDQAFAIEEWVGLFPEPDYQNVILDMHSYQCFSEGLRQASQTAHMIFTCAREVEKVTIQTLPVITGEWSFAWKVESNFASGEPFPNPSEVNFMKGFALAQMHAYEAVPNTLGWYFWNFKTEDAVMWNYLLAIMQGWVPLLPKADLVAAACDNLTLWQEQEQQPPPKTTSAPIQTTIVTVANTTSPTIVATEKADSTSPLENTDDPIRSQDNLFEISSAASLHDSNWVDSLLDLLSQIIPL